MQRIRLIFVTRTIDDDVSDTGRIQLIIRVLDAIGERETVPVALLRFGEIHSACPSGIRR